MVIGKLIRRIATNVEAIVIGDIKKNKDTIYGARALRKQLGIFSLARPTKDFDIYTNKSPRERARELERKLDQATGSDVFFVKPALHQGTYKVVDKGADNKPNTDDDSTVADMSRKKSGFKTIMIDGINYADVSEIKKDRYRSLRDKESAFRHEKDMRDLLLIKAQKRFERNKIRLGGIR